MKPTQAIAAVTTDMIKGSLPEFASGDTVRVSVRVVEGNRERIQVFEGVVMRKRGGGVNANFTVRRIAAHGIGVERTFLLNSPRIDNIEVVRRGVVRRAQLYYLRGLTGKAARIKERRYRPGADRTVDQAQALQTVEEPETELETPIENEEDALNGNQVEESAVSTEDVSTEDAGETETTRA